ncbi:MAG: flagellar hook capping protein [Planctomycetota bacterium]|nr:flagellar hook capping protein [Planctomycetota bacterium]
MAVSSVSNEMGRDQFLQLLVTQLKNQDPLDPVKNEDFLAQLAQFSTLEGMQQLNTSFSDLLALQQLTEGANLIGKMVTFQADGSSVSQQQVVERVSVQNGKLVLVTTDGISVPIANIQGLAAQDATPA